jgi:enhancing lycopene biosynthesis protein 2
MSKLKAAVVLCGCGRGDGSEIHESVSVLIALSRAGASYRCFAPDQPLADVINHATGEAMRESRNAMVEAARISRGEISPLTSLHARDFDALIFPGGFGAAKNLITYAHDGEQAKVHPEVTRVMREFHASGKPIGLCCIAPMIAAKVLGTHAGGPGVRVTLGADEACAKVVHAWGSTCETAPVEHALTDERQRVVTSPAYMYADATPAQVFDGISAMVVKVLELAAKPGASR